MIPDIQINLYLFCILEFSLNFQSQKCSFLITLTSSLSCILTIFECPRSSCKCWSSTSAKWVTTEGLRSYYVLYDFVQFNQKSQIMNFIPLFLCLKTKFKKRNDIWLAIPILCCVFVELWGHSNIVKSYFCALTFYKQLCILVKAKLLR